MTIYRGFDIELNTKDGKFYVYAEDGECISSGFKSITEAQDFIDAHKRRGGK